MAPPRLATHLFGPFHMVHLVSSFRMGPAEPAAPVVVTTAVPWRSYEVSLEGQESSVGALVGLFQAQLEGVLVGVLVLQQQLADPLAMTLPLGFDILQSELDAIVNMRSEKATSLLWARAQHCVNAVFWSAKLSQGLHATPAVVLQDKILKPHRNNKRTVTSTNAMGVGAAKSACVHHLDSSAEAGERGTRHMQV